MDEDVVLGAEVRVRRRPKAGAVLAIRLPSDLLARLDDRARAEDRTISAVVRRAITDYLGGTYSISTATTMTIPFEEPRK